MANTYTSNVNLAKPATSDTGWGTPLNANADALDAINAIGALAVALHETPSSSLAVKVSAGRYRKADGTLATYAGTASQTLTLSATNYVYLLDSTGVLTVSTSGWPAAFHVPLAIAVCGATTVTTLTDSRVPCSSAGANLNSLFLPLAANDALATQVVNTGVSNGVQIGASTSDKLAFWGGTVGGPPTVTGSRAGNAAVQSLLSGLAARGLIIDSSSA